MYSKAVKVHYSNWSPSRVEQFISQAVSYNAKVRVAAGSTQLNANSAFSVIITLIAAAKEDLEISAEGPEEVKAVEELSHFFDE